MPPASWHYTDSAQLAQLDGGKMEIIGKVDTDEKRLQMPGTFITLKCPQCETEYKLELVDQIHYPCSDEKHIFYGECEKCETYWEVPYQVEVFTKITI